MNAITAPTTVKVYRMSTPDHECPWGLRAINLLNEKGISFEDIKLTSQEQVNRFKSEQGVATIPQIFFGDERIGGYTDLAKYLQVKPETADYSYTPVITLFTTAGLMTLATSSGLTGFMGISLSMLASLKLMDLQSFAESFAKYDLITQHYHPYGKIYPFAELLTGLGFLSGATSTVTGLGSFLIGFSGTISVFKAIYIDKMSLNCACIGGNSKAPLGIVSLTENAIMAVMGLMLIFSSFSPQEAKSLRPFDLAQTDTIQQQKSVINKLDPSLLY